MNANSNKRSAELKKVAMNLWVIYSPTYAKNVGTYQFLLQKKRELEIYPLKKIPKQILTEYPDIPFLGIQSHSEAEEYLDSMSNSAIISLIEYIRYVTIDHHAYITVVGRINDFIHQIKYDGKKNRYATDPNSPTYKKGSSLNKRHNHEADNKH